MNWFNISWNINGIINKIFIERETEKIIIIQQQKCRVFPTHLLSGFPYTIFWNFYYQINILYDLITIIQLNYTGKIVTHCLSHLELDNHYKCKVQSKINAFFCVCRCVHRECGAVYIESVWLWRECGAPPLATTASYSMPNPTSPNFFPT